MRKPRGKKKSHVGDFILDRKISKRILKKWGVKMRSGLKWLRIWSYSITSVNMRLNLRTP